MSEEFDIGSLVRIDGRHYTIEKVMRGGMGLVLLCSAVNESDSIVYRNKLAAKVFFPGQDTHQMRGELQLWQGLRHINIAPLLAVGHVNDWLCASMPWFQDGAISASNLRDNGGPALVQQMLRQVCLALDYAFKEHRVLHLDIKPANVLMRAGHFVVADWGIAKFSARTALNKGPLSGGTLPYMSPERFLREPTSAVADIYSVGMTAFEMLTGLLPFSESSAEEMAYGITSGRVSMRLIEASKQLPRNWGNLVFQCCAYEASSRPQSYQSVQNMIETLEVQHVRLV